jgi:hypothetical protein
MEGFFLAHPILSRSSQRGSRLYSYCTTGSTVMAITFVRRLTKTMILVVPIKLDSGYFDSF